MRVVNVWDYGGRDGARKAGYVLIGRPSTLGNDFSHRSYSTAPYSAADRTEAVEAYRRWLYAVLTGRDECVVRLCGREVRVPIAPSRRHAVLAALDRLAADSVLACHCKPRLCHGDVIVRAWEWREQCRSFS